jgi:glutaredoxin
MGLWLKIVTLVVLFSVPLVHAAKLYKWVDKDGNVSYHDQPPSTAGYRVEEKNIGTRAASANKVAADVLEKYPIVLYTTPKCSSCDLARAYLKGRGVPYTEKNVDGDRTLQDELIKQAGGLAVPTIMVGSKVMKGYLESLLEGELDQAGYPKPGTDEAAESENQEKPES